MGVTGCGEVEGESGEVEGESGEVEGESKHHL